MLGYVRCATGDLLVKHHRLYQAMYCGLCHSIGKNASKALLPFLSYDFVFLAFLRLLATGEGISLEKQFCLLHPLKDKKMRVADNQALSFAARSALFLTYEKMQDDLVDRDTSFGRRLLVSLWSPILKGSCKRVLKKDPSLAPLAKALGEQMEEGRRLEREGADLDTMCEHFASCLSQIAAFGLEERSALILNSLGGHLGRFIYTLDAANDLDEDEKSGAFNPLLQKHGSAEKAREEFAALDLVLSYYIAQMKLALDLLEGDPALVAVCDNIISLGLTESAREIMKPKMEKMNERPL